jgi:hypothetical protein
MQEKITQVITKVAQELITQVITKIAIPIECSPGNCLQVTEFQENKE